MHFIAIVIVIWVIRSVMKSNGNGNASTANDAPGRLFILITPFSFVVATVVTGLLAPLYPALSGILNLILILLMCFPSWVAQLCIRLGMVKASFYLGRIAIAVHTRDPFGGALFYGWRALQNTKPEKRATQLAWLEAQLAAHKSVLRSGAMVMQVFFKRERISDEQLMAQLRLLNGCNKRLIPGNISRYCLRYMLARDLPTGDWQLIGATTAQWLDVGINPLASWLHEFHWNQNRKHKISIRLFLFYKYLLAGRPKIAKYLPPDNVNALDEPSSSSPQVFSLADLKQSEWAFIKSNSNAIHSLNQHWQEYLVTSRDHWLARLQQLGSYNAEEGFAKIAQSVQDLLAYRDGETALESEAISEDRDRDFRLLRIKIDAVNQRLQQNALMTGAQELEEWFTMAQLAQRLATDSMSESQVFHMLRNCCWNWVARLWNDANNKPLAFLICSYLSIQAYSASDMEAMEIFGGIVGDKYK